MGWFRDTLYNVIYSEGDFALQFMADFFCSPNQSRTDAHLKRQLHHKEQSAHQPLSNEEQRLFIRLLQRRAGEDQVSYWKRKRALLNHPNKKQLVADYKKAKQRAEIDAQDKQEEGISQDVDALVEEYQAVGRHRATQQHSHGSRGAQKK